MTPSDSSAVPRPAFVAERLAARRQRVRTIRKLVVTFAVALFLGLMIVIIEQSHLAATSSATTTGSASSSAGSTTSSASGSTSSGGGSTSSSNSGTSSSFGSTSPVTSSQS